MNQETLYSPPVFLKQYELNREKIELLPSSFLKIKKRERERRKENSKSYFLIPAFIYLLYYILFFEKKKAFSCFMNMRNF